jgi:ERF superfamily
MKTAYVELTEGLIASDYAMQNLNKALGLAQGEFTSAVKTEENKWGGYKYTPLESIIKAARPALVKNHLTVSQFPITDLEIKAVSVVTRLVHWDSGEWLQHTLVLPGELALGKDGAAKFNQQTIGGSSTYGQKYGYKAILGIPDGEEMIDSTEEKGDLPARTKAQKRPLDVVGSRHSSEGAPQFGDSADARDAVPAPANIRTTFFASVSKLGWGLGDLKGYLKKAYPEAKSTGDLTEADLEQILEFCAKVKPTEVDQ